MQYYCPACFAEIPRDTRVCPACSADLVAWEERHSFTQRLIHALGHPNPEARMAAIISLGYRGEAVAAIPLANCALAHPIDIVQALEIVASISRLPPGPERAQALALLANHPAQSIRSAVENLA